MAAFDSTRRPALERRLPRLLRIPSPAMLSAAALVAAAALLPVVQSSSATSAGYETRQLEQQRADLQAALYNSQTEIAQLGSLDRIEREARDRLGMAPAQRTLAIQVSEEAPPPSLVPARFLPAEPASMPRQATENKGGLRGLLAKLAIH